MTGEPESEIEAEIIRHHRVIERWLSGAATAEEFGSFAEAHAGGFTLTDPDGTTLTRAQVLARVEGLHGAAPGLRIDIRRARVVASEGPLVVAAFEEWQQNAVRQSTAILLRDGAQLRWLHLHETWMPPSPPARVPAE
ncbi:DUF4440 domain-containing protein [Nonomuraea longicatena]|uniref:DUF4440 domain-containing protein n=1 Tax=Nonomuraea longicatena TaxID=83682 RepID=A0ABN1Q555_9ACTN